MGNLCGARVDNSAPNDATGLTNKEMKLIRELWYSVVDRMTYKQTGHLFFLKLFEMYPYMQEYFPEFARKDVKQLKASMSLRAHGISVFVAITSYVDVMDDPPTLIALIHKRVPSHHQRGVNFADLENLKTAIVEFLGETASGNRKNIEKALAAWNKFLSVHNAVYQAKVDEITAENQMSLSTNTTETVNTDTNTGSWSSKFRS